MGFQAVAWAQKQKLGATDKLVLLTLASYSDTDGTCWPSHQRLADDCGLTRRAVILHIDALERRGLLAKERRKKPSGDYDSNRYRLCMGGSERHSLGVVNDVHKGSERNDVEVVNDVHTNLLVESVRESGRPTAASLVTAIRSLVQQRGISRFIPRGAVLEMGLDVGRAYDAMGGPDRFLECLPKSLPFLISDFAEQLTIARKSA